MHVLNIDFAHGAANNFAGHPSESRRRELVKYPVFLTINGLDLNRVGTDLFTIYHAAASTEIFGRTFEQ